MNQITLLKLLDKIIGYPLSSLLPQIWKYHKNTPEKFESILIIRPGGIGDAVLLLPALNALKATFPDSQIDVLCEKRNADVFSLSKETNRIYLYDKVSSLFQCLSSKYDVVIDTEQWHRLSAVVAYLTRAPIRIGFRTNERIKLFTHHIPYSHDDYEVYSFFHLIEPLINITHHFNVYEPFIDISHSMYPHPLSGLKKEDKLIAIFPGTSIKQKRWGGDKFGKVARSLYAIGHTIVIFGSSADRDNAERIKKYVANCIDLTGKTNLRDVAAVLKMSKVLITTDTGLMHLAYAVGTPTVSLFGPSIEKKWAPKGNGHIVINKHLGCSPCTRFGYTPRCKRNVECLSLISVDEVIRAAEIILNTNNADIV